jgi:hypothetical protein|tara:strand:- start:145 stop:381 length:237 start_codon:yes stop_codon:yes gene_type:complete
MALKIPLTYNTEKLNEFFKKISPTIKYFGYVFWVGLIIYFFYKSLKSENNFSLFFSMALLGMLLNEIYNKWKINRKKI